ncbi:ATP-binding protein [Nocardiopsis dassonvillei]|uniref:ATP-binding protein n=1 Tax=Nocardiopsis dassonvillei TaxID=2014 RepID=UPI00200BFD07|nr:ATP-binding protein [Nocardiopsis dassonvillei]MCK9871001.1 ATP-binding protein [Nocardiopsis dassonvillei]
MTGMSAHDPAPVPGPFAFWGHLDYACDLSELARVRSELARDLAGFDPDLVATVQLVASELVANSCKYARSEEGVTRTLSMPDERTLRLTVSDAGGPTLPRIPAERTDEEWEAAEGQRGLLLVRQLSRTWASFAFPRRYGLGTHVWAAFDAEPPRNLRGAW